MAPLEPYEKIRVQEAFLKSAHGEIECQDCHGGNPVDPDWQTAHKDVIEDPSFPDPTSACGECHENLSESGKASVHYTLNPIRQVIRARSGSIDSKAHAQIAEAEQKHCSQCHASCGQCHVSRPDYVDGGFLAGHVFQKRPPMDSTCAGCHGGRAYAELTGQDKAFSPDVHYRKKDMTCSDCHKNDEMHASASNSATRMDLAHRPRCEGCHPDAVSDNSKTQHHQEHKGKVACQVCHALPYKNCYSCHVGTDDGGIPYFQCRESTVTMKIGLDPNGGTTSGNDYYVLLRHPPTNPEIFKFYTQTTLSDFNTLPTWKFTSPHNIQRITPQAKACNNCHGNRELFLSSSDLRDWEQACNQAVVVPDAKVPARIAEQSGNGTRREGGDHPSN